MVLGAVFVDEGPVDRDTEHIVDDVPPVDFRKGGHESGHWRGLDSGGHPSEDVRASRSVLPLFSAVCRHNTMSLKQP